VASAVPFQYLAHLVTVPVQAGGTEARFVFDTGIGVTLVSRSLAGRVGCRDDGRDETGHGFTRYFATLPGPVSVTGAPGICQADPAVMFQKIICDGLAGHAFLSNFAVTYDLPHARMIFAPG